MRATGRLETFAAQTTARPTRPPTDIISPTTSAPKPPTRQEAYPEVG